tara:strand:+ start:283 stop:1461 length:1179 start_codon:yes stop_codon:yes gene_type:complete
LKSVCLKLIAFCIFISTTFSQDYKLSGDSLFDVAAKSVVFIFGESPDTIAYGSGVFISYEGEIVTNYHVIEGFKSEELAIWIYEGIHEIDKLAEDAKPIPVDIIAVDKSKDLALLKTRENIDDIIPIYIAYDEDIVIGSQVFAIGHPQGLLWSFTEGIVNRIANNTWDYNSETEASGFFESFYNWWNDTDTEQGYTISAKSIFTQTPINPGNSGGLLMNSKGDLVGINTSSRNDSDSINIAVHADEVIKFLEKNGIEFDDITTANEYLEDLSYLISNFIIIPPQYGEGFSFVTKFEGEKIDVEVLDPKNEDEAVYIGIDLDRDDNFDILIYDLDDDGSYSYWDIDLDKNGDFEWSGNINTDRMTRFYRKFKEKVDKMLIDSFNELERLEMIE